MAQEALVALEAAAQAVALEPEPAPRCGMPAARYFEGLPVRDSNARRGQQAKG